ncbi:MAG: hypothetical protein H6R01_430 [Burkholderiaceae bacterium]|nr:hypothetical protein [Burkholderiaceae bacterium]
MFGIDDMILFPLIGSAIGGATKGLKGAAAGGLLGLGGALAAPALGLGTAAGEAGAAAGAGQAGTAAAGADAVYATPAAQAFTTSAGVPTVAAKTETGLLSQMGGGMKSASAFAKDMQPLMAAGAFGMNMAKAAQPNAVQASPVMQNQGGAQGLASLVSQNQQQYMTELQSQAALRQQRRNLWGQ